MMTFWSAALSRRFGFLAARPPSLRQQRRSGNKKSGAKAPHSKWHPCCNHEPGNNPTQRRAQTM